MSHPTFTGRQLVDAIEGATGQVATIEHTGGGVATGFTGATIAIGPGRYDWSDPLASIFYTDDLYVGIGESGIDGVSLEATVTEVSRLLDVTELCDKCAGAGYVGDLACQRCMTFGRVPKVAA